MRRGIRTLVACSLLASFAQGQNPYGRITGRVTDASGAFAPNASIRATHIDTGVSTSTRSNQEGNYELPNLIPGLYRIAVELEGFKRYERTAVEVRVGDVLSVPVQLEVGQTADSVTVPDEAPLLESASASLGQVVDSRRITDLPVPGASLLYLTTLMPGVFSLQAPTYPYTPNTLGGSSDIGAAGTRARSGEFTMDGIPAMTRSGQIAFAPIPEMVQEFRVQTAPVDAALGHFTGAHVNIVMRSGGNEFHGNFIYSATNRTLMSRDYFTNRFIYDTRTGPVTQEKIDGAWPLQHTIRYRGSLSGPVLLSRLYNGRNRTFWTYGIDVMDRIRSQREFYTIPGEAQRTGDFSALLAAGGVYQIFDPATIAPAPNGRFSRQPFGGNRIPASRIDPIARKLLDFYPAPNTPGTSDGRNNYTNPNVTAVDFRTHTGRVDHSFSERHRMYGSLNWLYQQDDGGRIFPSGAAGSITPRHQRAFALDDVFLPRPDLVLNLRYGLTRFSTWAQPVSLGFDLATLGFPTSLVSQLDRTLTAIPAVTIDGYTGLSSATGSPNATTYHYLSGQASHTRGTHTLRFGGEFRVLQETNYAYGNVAPALAFSTTYTRGPLDNSPVAPIGQGLASFLLGIPTGGGIDRNASYAEQSRYGGLFVQDDWKITRTLTLNLGLRWEVETPITERFNRTNRGFDFTTPNPIEAAARAVYAASPIAEVPAARFRTTGGLLFAAQQGVPRGLWNTDRNNFAPRIGLAWQMRPRTVVRAGYGIFYDLLGTDQENVPQQGFSQRTNIVPTLDNGLTFRATLANPLPDGLLEPPGASLGLLTFVGRGASYFLPTRRSPYVQRWTFNIQQELPHRVLLELGYMGNRGVRLDLSRDWNATPQQYLSRSPERDQPTINFLTQAVRSPFSGIAAFQGSGLAGANTTRAQLLKPYPHFTGVSAATNEGLSWYHSLQVRAEKRFSRSYSLQASYTWSKFMEAVDLLNDADLHPHHVISPQDRPHRVVVSGIWELPVGRGRRWMAGGPRGAEYAFGGWSLQGIYQAQSGPPLGFGNALFRGGIHDIVLPRNERTVARHFNTEAGFERNPARVLANNVIAFPLRFTGIRAPGYNNWDLSLFKNVRLRERFVFQFRAEAQDAFNHAIFGAPNTSPTSTLFGQITVTQGTGQRRFQLGGKVMW